MKILTGNDLASGDVVWWDGKGWSRDVNDAVDVGNQDAVILAAEEAAQRVNASYAIAATKTEAGVRPAHIKDRIRALGPTVRLDLSLRPGDADAAKQVI